MADSKLRILIADCPLSANERRREGRGEVRGSELSVTMGTGRQFC